jgi:hypothetical protein
MDKLFNSNVDALMSIYQILFPKYPEQPGIKTLTELIVRESNVGLSDKESRFCYGMSKMTVKDEVTSRDSYDKL